MPSEQKPTNSDLSQPLIEAILSAAEPGSLLQQAVDYSPGQLTIGQNELSIPDQGRMLIIAIGKAAPAMASAAAEIFGERLSAGLVTLLPGQDFDAPKTVRTFQCGHPLPDEGSLAAGAHAADLLSDLEPEDRVLALVSGGGSAMFELLPDGITLDSLRSLTEAMMEAGFAIDRINQVRRRLSLVKAGGLAQLATPAMTIGLILSDVVGDHLELVASGPTVPTNERVSEIETQLKERGLWQSLPDQIKARLSHPPKPFAAIFQPVNNLIGSNEVALQASEELLSANDYEVQLHTSTMEGEASEIGREFATQVTSLKPGEALLMGGEATVTVRGEGKGGPLQELALAAALEMAGGPARQLLALATDGIDGDSPAAGAIVDQRTADDVRQKGIDPVACLADNDSYRALKAADSAVEIGPTGTNINDVVIGWCPHSSDG